MKSKSIIFILAVISLTFSSTFFYACNKNGESVETVSAEKEKTVDAIEQFEKIGNKSNSIAVLEAIDEILNSLPGVVASVNDVKITNMPIKETLQRLKVQASHQNQSLNKEQIENIVNQVLEMEIQREVLYQKGKELGIEVMDKDIVEITDRLKSRYKSEEEFLNDFSKRGLSLEKLKKEIHRNLVVSKVVQKEISDKIKISDEQAMDFYKKNEKSFKDSESVHAAHILIKVDNKMVDKDKKAAKNKIEDILSKARAGEDFAELAKKYSEGPSASRGGDLSFFTRGQMVKEFENVAFNLKVGEISDAVKTQFGYHIIKAYDKKEGGGVRPFAEVKNQIFNFLKQSETQQKTKAYLEDIKKKADIKRLL